MNLQSLSPAIASPARLYLLKVPSLPPNSATNWDQVFKYRSLVCGGVGGSSHSNHTCLPCHFFFDCIWMNVVYVRSGTSHMPLMYRDILCMLLMVCTKFTIASFVISYTLQLRSFEESSQGPTTAAAPLGPISSDDTSSEMFTVRLLLGWDFRQRIERAMTTLMGNDIKNHLLFQVWKFTQTPVSCCLV